MIERNSTSRASQRSRAPRAEKLSRTERFEAKSTSLTPLGTRRGRCRTRWYPSGHRLHRSSRPIPAYCHGSVASAAPGFGATARHLSSTDKGGSPKTASPHPANKQHGKPRGPSTSGKARSQLSRVDALEQRLAELESAFPEGGLAAHRAHHERLVARRHAITRFWQDVLVKAAAATLVGAAGAILVLVWEGFRAGLM